MRYKQGCALGYMDRAVLSGMSTSLTWEASSVCPTGKAKAKDTEKKAPAAEEVDNVVVEEPKDAGEGQTGAEREEAEQEEAGVCHATALCVYQSSLQRKHWEAVCRQGCLVRGVMVAELEGSKEVFVCVVSC